MSAPSADPDAITAARELVALLENAKPIPLSKQVRIDREKATEFIDALLGTTQPDDHPELHSIAQEIDAELRQARQVPLTFMVRIPRHRAEALANRLRMASGLAASGGET